MDPMSASFFDKLFALYGAAAIPIIGLLLIVKYLLDKDKQREAANGIAMKAQTEKTEAERARGDQLQRELLEEARSGAMLTEELRKAMEQQARLQAQLIDKIGGTV